MQKIKVKGQSVGWKNRVETDGWTDRWKWSHYLLW